MIIEAQPSGLTSSVRLVGFDSNLRNWTTLHCACWTWPWQPWKRSPGWWARRSSRSLSRCCSANIVEEAQFSERAQNSWSTGAVFASLVRVLFPTRLAESRLSCSETRRRSEPSSPTAGRLPTTADGGSRTDFPRKPQFHTRTVSADGRLCLPMGDMVLACRPLALSECCATKRTSCQTVSLSNARPRCCCGGDKLHRCRRSRWCARPGLDSRPTTISCPGIVISRRTRNKLPWWWRRCWRSTATREDMIWSKNLSSSAACSRIRSSTPGGGLNLSEGDLQW